MPWSYASSRLALILRRWRDRFGISAPQVAVRMHVPWRLRAFGVVAILGLLLVLAAWVFDFGQEVGGASRSEIRALQAANRALEEEVSRLRSLVAASENDLHIEKAAKNTLAEKNSALVEEVARLKEELAVLERLAKTKKK